MKLLKRTSLSILTILFLACSSIQGIAHAGQDSIRTFSWEGLSLSMTPNQIVEALENDGYTLFRVTEGKKKISIYQRKTGTGSNKVQFIEKNGALIKLIFSDTRAGGKKNSLSSEAADNALESIKGKLGIDDSSCTPAAKGGGKCNGQPGSAIYDNSFSVNVTTKATKFALTSKPISQAVIDANNQLASGLASAYGCLGTTDITSAKEIYDCIESVSKELEELDKAKKINRSKHMPVYLSSTTVPCWQLSNFYKRGLFFLKSGSDSAPIPSCKTFAAAVKLSAGAPPFWSGCLNEEESNEFLKSCIDGVNPSYFKLVNQRIPSCKDYQLAYQRGVVAARDISINISAVSPPECEHVLAFAKSLRESLTKELLACAGYDPDKASAHILKCITTDRDLWLLRTCVHVQASYRTKLMQSNYGTLPDTYRPIACDQTKDLIAKADSVRKRLAAKAAEERRQARLAREAKENRHKEYKIGPSEELKKALEKRYGDTPEKTASRTSKLENEIKANGGNIKLACTALGRENIFCPPTLEEIRLAMMRNHAKIKNLRMIDGHMLHGNLNDAAQDALIAGAASMPGGLALFANIPGSMKMKSLWVELLYKEPRLLSDCTSSSASSYDCFFALDIREKGTVQFALTNSVSKQLRYIKRYEHSYNFRIGEDGLWQAERTAEQVAKDQVMAKKIQDREDYEAKVAQELIDNMENPFGVDGL